jgi:hypothetical protein
MENTLPGLSSLADILSPGRYPARLTGKRAMALTSHGANG